MSNEDLRPTIKSDLADLIWEATENLTEMVGSALEDWLQEWGQADEGLPYAPRVDDLSRELAGFIARLRKVAEDMDSDYDADRSYADLEKPSPGGLELPLSSFEEAMLMAGEDADDTDDGDDAVEGPSDEILRRLLAGPTHDAAQENKLKELMGGVTAESISLGGDEPTDDA